MKPPKFSQNHIEHFNEGKATAHTRFFDHYKSRVKRLVNIKLGVFYGDDDLVIEIFHKVIQKTIDLKVQFETIENLEFYLWRITESKCKDHKKKQKTPVIHMDNAREYYQRIQDKARMRAEAKEIAREYHALAIQLLPPQCREIFMMSYIHDMRNKDIAEKLGISKSTVENQINIALRKLREETKDDDGKMNMIKMLLPLLWVHLNSL